MLTPEELERLERIEGWLDIGMRFYQAPDVYWLISKIRQADDAPPPADAALLASANRMLLARVARLERVLAAEQGREGLEGWRWDGRDWRLSKNGRHISLVEHLGNGRWAAWVGSDSAGPIERSALEAMGAAEAALAGSES